MKKLHLFLTLTSLTCLIVLLSALTASSSGGYTVYMPLADGHSQYWAITYGGSEDDQIYSARQNDDGSLLLSGRRYYQDGPNLNNMDWVMKLNEEGGILWEKSFGVTSITDIHENSGGDFLLTGSLPFASVGNAWLANISDQGELVWQKQYGDGALWDGGRVIQATPDGGYIFLGNTTASSTGTSEQAWVIKLDGAGSPLWGQTIGAGHLNSLQLLPGGGYIAAGQEKNVAFRPRIVRLASDGTVVWDKLYGGYQSTLQSIQTTPDGNIIAAGYTSEYGAGDSDAWIFKLDINGAIIWQRTYGDSSADRAVEIQNSADGGFLVAGTTNDDAWILKLNSDGTVAWQKTYGGPNPDSGTAILELANGDLLLTGETDSFGAGAKDVWIWRLTAGGDIAGCSLIGSSSTAVYDHSYVTGQDRSDTYNVLTPQFQDTNVTPQDLTLTTTTLCKAP